MPEMNGIEFLKEIRNKGNQIPFIVFTGKGREEIIIKLFNEGADFYLQKGGAIEPLFAELTHKIIQAVKQKQAACALRESEERFRTLLHCVPAVAVQGYFPDHKVVYWNEANTKIYGYTPDEAIGSDIRDLIVPPEARELVTNEIAKMAETGIPLAAGEMYLTHKNGSMVPVFSSHAVVQIEGKKPMLFCIDIDLSEQKKAEEALLDVNRKLKLLSSITNKDISNEVSLCEKKLDIAQKSENLFELKEYLNQFREHFGSIEHHIEFSRQYQDLGLDAPKWQEVKTNISGLSGSVSIKTENIDSLYLYADPMLGKVFSNLIDNTRRYGGRATEIKVNVRKTDDDMILIWEDNGSGIPVKEKERIFERGYGKNFGIGLYLCREILSITGISIKETGDPKKGAKFEIHVPKDLYNINPPK